MVGPLAVKGDASQPLTRVKRGRQNHVQQLLPAESRSSFKVIYEKNNKFSLAEAQI